MILAPHPGQFTQANKPFEEQIGFLAQNGFKAIEDNWLRWRTQKEQDELLDALQKHQVHMGTFVPHHIYWDEAGINTQDVDKIKRFYSEIKSSVQLAKTFGTQFATIVPGKQVPNIPKSIQLNNVIAVLRDIIPLLKENELTLLLEPHAQERHPNMLIQTLDDALILCEALESANVRILYDTYHIAAMQYDLLLSYTKYKNWIAYVQIADYPGRMEPGSGNLPLLDLLKLVCLENKNTYIGLEHGWSNEQMSPETKVTCYKNWIK